MTVVQISCGAAKYQTSGSTSEKNYAEERFSEKAIRKIPKEMLLENETNH